MKYHLLWNTMSMNVINTPLTVKVVALNFSDMTMVSCLSWASVKWCDDANVSFIFVDLILTRNLITSNFHMTEMNTILLFYSSLDDPFPVLDNSAIRHKACQYRIVLSFEMVYFNWNCNLEVNKRTARW